MSSVFMVNLLGVLLMIAIAWWFWFSSSKTVFVPAKGVIEIIVEGGVYTPANINLRVKHNQLLRFIRKDASPCAGIVRFDAIHKSAELPVNQPVDMEVRFDEPGHYEFTCQMGMYRGKITVS